MNKLYFYKKGISTSILISLIILVVIIVIASTASGGIYETVTTTSKERECLLHINNIDRLILTTSSNEIRKRFEQSCLIHEVTLRNEETLKNEILRCNSRAQRLISQSRFIESNPNICVICSEISSSFNINIVPKDIIENEEYKSRVKDNIIEVNSESTKQNLQFKIIEDKIMFEIVPDGENSCSNILN